MTAQFRAIAVTSFLVGLLVITGCSAIQPPEQRSAETVEVTLQELKQHFEAQNLLRFMRYIHENYDDGVTNKTGLRFDISEVTDQYSNIDLTFYGLRKTANDKNIGVRASWNLRWTCTDRGDGCVSIGNTILRRGVTTFEFRKVDGDYRLTSQRGDRIFGALTPGAVKN